MPSAIMEFRGIGTEKEAATCILRGWVSRKIWLIKKGENIVLCSDNVK